MLPSKYVNLVDGGDVGLLVNGMSGAIDIVGTQVLNWFKGLEPVEQTRNELVNVLARRGHLWDPEQGDETLRFRALVEALHRQRLATTINSFWVIPTYKCNLRCYYCFQGHELHRGEGLAVTDMSPEHATAMIDAFDSVGGPGPMVTDGKGRYITLFGGEPLMNSTRGTVEAIVQKARAKGYRVGAVTNGVELTSFEHLLGPNEIRWVQITLDGLAEYNEKRRLPTTGTGFDRIVAGISLALDRGVQVSVRTNADRKLANLVVELESWAADRGWTKHKNFSWYMTPTETHHNPSLGKVTIPMSDLIRTVRQKGNGTIRVPYRGKFHRLFRSLAQNGIAEHFETSSCGAHTNMYFFDPRGLVYACAEQVGNPDAAIGTYTAKGICLDSEKASLWTSRHIGNMPTCSSCANAAFCGGGCANAAQLETADFFGPRCHGIKDAFQDVGREYLSDLLAELRSSGTPLDGYSVYHVNSDEIVARGAVGACSQS